MKKILNYIKQILLGIAIVIAVIFLSSVANTIIALIIMSLKDSLIVYTLLSFGPYSFLSWIILILMLIISIIIIMTPPFFLARWVYKETKSFKNLGIKTNEFFWAVAVILPTAFFIFPVFLIKRNILWPEKVNSFNKNIEIHEI